MVIEITELSVNQHKVGYTVAIGSNKNRMAFEKEFGEAHESSKNGMFATMCRMADFVNNELKAECMFTVC